MAKIERHLKTSFEDTVRRLDEAVMKSAMSMQLAEASSMQLGGQRLEIRVYDKYYMRNGSRASLSLVVAGSDGDVVVSAIGAGGGAGLFWRFSWGAEQNLLGPVEKCLSELEARG